MRRKDKKMAVFKEIIQEKAKQYAEKIVEWRRHFHENPELSGEEVETSKYIQEQLFNMGIPFNANVFQYAVIGEIKGAHPGKTVALRADMDALPVTEQTGLPFASKNTGKMHACGHDSHMAILLGAAAVLNSIKDQLHGTVKLVFQPAEESGTIRGAYHIVETGVLEGVEEIFGLHVWPDLPVGTVGLRKGNLMAASDRFDVHIKGKATHGAMPHLGTDAIVAAANWIVNVQSIVARETDPMENLVCTIGTFKSGERYNVGAEDAYLEGTCRTYNPAKRDYIENRLIESLKALDLMFGTTSVIDYQRGHSATINDADSIDHLTKVGTEYLGEEAIVLPEVPAMTAEDFSAYLNKYKGAFIWLGTGYEGNPALHHNKFAIDESVLQTGVTLMSGAIAELLVGEQK